MYGFPENKKSAGRVQVDYKVNVRGPVVSQQEVYVSAEEFTHHSVLWQYLPDETNRRAFLHHAGAILTGSHGSVVTVGGASGVDPVFVLTDDIGLWADNPNGNNSSELKMRSVYGSLQI